MNLRRLGRTDLSISEIALGTVELGMDYGIRTGKPTNKPEEKVAARLLNRALDLGVNFIDTAAAYGDSEAIIGRALHKRRSEFYLATKCLHRLDEGLDNQSSRRHIRQSIEQSLHNLKTDRIDLIQIHGRDFSDIERRMMEEGEILEELEQAREEGKVRYIGYSSYSEQASLLAIENGRWDTLQIAYNIFDQRPAERVIPAARAHDVGIVIRSALLKGALTKKAEHLPPHLAELVGRTNDIAEVLDGAYTLPQAALRFVLSNPSISTIIVGADKMEYLDEAVSVSDGQLLPNTILTFLRSQSLEDQDLLNPGKWGIP